MYVQVYKVSSSTLLCRLFALNHQLKNFTLNHGPFGKCMKCNLIWINLVDLQYRSQNTCDMLWLTLAFIRVAKLMCRDLIGFQPTILADLSPLSMLYIIQKIPPTAFRNFWVSFRLGQPDHIPDHIH